MPLLLPHHHSELRLAFIKTVLVTLLLTQYDFCFFVLVIYFFYIISAPVYSSNFIVIFAYLIVHVFYYLVYINSLYV